MNRQKDPWFAPKRNGYGAGLPIAWQGWALLFGYLVLALACALTVEWGDATSQIIAGVILALATIVFIILAKQRIHGGWKWRANDKESD